MTRLSLSDTNFRRIGRHVAGFLQPCKVLLVDRRDIAMLSRLASKNILSAASGLRQAQQGCPALLSRVFHTDVNDNAKTQELIENFERCNKKYYGPERDTANFPQPRVTERVPDVRLGFIPKTWFDALYDKTGVSGPYVFLFGLATYVHSKEILVMDHEYFDLLCFIGAAYLITKKWGDRIANFIYKDNERISELNYTEPIGRSRRAFQRHVDQVNEKIVQEGRHKYMFEVQKENVDLQLEAIYRQRVAQAHQAVKRRLDYQVEMLNTKKRLEQQHMVDWIVSNVIKGITPQQEKDAIASCITNLQRLAKAQPAV